MVQSQCPHSYTISMKSYSIKFAEFHVDSCVVFMYGMVLVFYKLTALWHNRGKWYKRNTTREVNAMLYV